MTVVADAQRFAVGDEIREGDHHREAEQELHEQQGQQLAQVVVLARAGMPQDGRWDGEWKVEDGRNAGRSSWRTWVRITRGDRFSVMAERTPALVPYNRESNLDLLMEVGCGGELDVLIEPLVQPADFQFLDVLAELHEERAPASVATVFSRNGEVHMPRPWRLIRHAAAPLAGWSCT